MQATIGWAAAVLGLTAVFVVAARAQEAPQTPPVQGRPGGGRGMATFPAGQRPPGDAVQVAHGKTLYGVSCTACHGTDLRGGDLGGPNLLRSQVVLSDRDGELILPIIRGSRQSEGMDAIPMTTEDVKAVAAYLHSVLATLGGQGSPPSVGMAPPSVLVGDAAAGQKFFDTRCGGCHSPAGDLKSIGSRFADPKMLQNVWVSGGGGRGRGARGSVAPDAGDRRVVKVAVTLPSGESVEGRLVRIDDFMVTVGLNDGTTRTIRRDGALPKVEVRDPMKAHREMLGTYSDNDMHDVTAYLVTLK